MGSEKNREWRPVAVRRFGRLRVIWEDDVRMDPGKKKVQNWRKMTMDREALKRIVGQAKTHKELYCQEKKASLC